MSLRDFLIIDGFSIGETPVSYTHLDVYKRQGRNRPTVPFENHRLGAHVDHGFNTDDHSLFEKQMCIRDRYPDVVIGCFGGGSNFAGISFSFLRDNLTKGKNTVLGLTRAGGTLKEQLEKMPAVKLELADGTMYTEEGKIDAVSGVRRRARTEDVPVRPSKRNGAGTV